MPTYPIYEQPYLLSPEDCQYLLQRKEFKYKDKTPKQIDESYFTAEFIMRGKSDTSRATCTGNHFLSNILKIFTLLTLDPPPPQHSKGD